MLYHLYMVNKRWLILILGLLSLSFGMLVQANTCNDLNRPDVLYLPVKEAIKKGADFTAPNALAWHRYHRCSGCHIQAQSLMGLALSETKVEVDQKAKNFLLNTVTSSQQADGSLWIGSIQYPVMQTTLNVWSLLGWSNKTDSFPVMYKAASFLHKKAQGNEQEGIYLSPEHNERSWWANPVSQIALTAMGMADLLKTAPTLDLSQFKDYKLNEVLGLGNEGKVYDIETGEDGAIYVLKYNGQIDRVSLNTKKITVVATGLPAGSSGLAIAQDGSFYISGSYGRVVHVGLDGKWSYVTTSYYGNIIDVEISKDGTLYLSDYTYHRLLQFNPSDNSVKELARGGLLNHPTGLALDKQGNLYVANYSGFNILKWSTTNELTAFADGLAFPPLWLTTDAQDNLYVSASHFSINGYTPHGVYKISPEGVAQRILSVANSSIELKALTRAQGKIWVVDSTANKLNEIQETPIDTNLLVTFKEDLESIARYFLGNYQDNSEDVIIHAMRMTGLSEIQGVITDPSLAAQIAVALQYEESWLRNSQNIDGGWGSYRRQASDPLVTSMVGLALNYVVSSRYDVTMRRTVQYLIDTQYTDGSWLNRNNGLTTRLGATSFVIAYLPIALERLGRVGTLDLTITRLEADMTAFPAITAQVCNQGTIASVESQLSLYNGDPKANGAVMGIVQVPPIDANACTDIVINEKEYSNLKGKVNTITLLKTLANFGGAEAVRTLLRSVGLYDGTQSSINKIIDNVLLNNAVNFSGEMDLYAFIDSNEQLPECDETNNIVHKHIVAGSCKAYGKVYDRFGKPLSGVTLVAGRRTVTSNAMGEWEIRGLLEDDYTLTAEKEGYSFIPENFGVSENQECEVKIILRAIPSLKIWVSHEDTVQQGLEDSYIFTVFNNGDATATNVALRYQLPPDAEIVSLEALEGGSCTQGTDGFSCVLPNLTSKDSVKVYLVLKNSTVGQVESVLTASSSEYPENRQVIRTEVQPYLAVAITDNPDPALLNAPLHYAIEVNLNHTAPTEANNLILQLTLPDSVEFKAITTSQGQCDTTVLPHILCLLDKLELATLDKPSQVKLDLEVIPKDGREMTLMLEAQVNADEYPTHLTVEQTELLIADQLADFAIVLDITGSMQEEIDGTIQEIRQFVEKVPTNPDFWATLITFKDKDEVILQSFTNDLNVISDKLGEFKASGGGTCPEASVEALSKAVDYLKEGAVILFVTDAAHYDDADLAGLKQKIAAKKIELHVILTGDCP